MAELPDRPVMWAALVSDWRQRQTRRALLSGLGVDCEQWRAEVAQAATALQEYLIGIGVNVAAILHDGTS
jgi:hypothetical protein